EGGFLGCSPPPPPPEPPQPLRAEPVAEVPEGLGPDLAVGVPLRATRDVRVAGVRVPATMARGAPAAERRLLPDLAVHGLGPVVSHALTVVHEQPHIGPLSTVALEALLDHVSHARRVAPRLPTLI